MGDIPCLSVLTLTINGGSESSMLVVIIFSTGIVITSFTQVIVESFHTSYSIGFKESGKT